MTLVEQAARRADLAHKIGCEPLRWIATPEAESQLGFDPGPAGQKGGATLLGLPVERADATRSEWGLDLVLAPRSL